MGKAVYYLCVVMVGFLVINSDPARADVSVRNVHFWMKAFIANPAGNASTDFTKTEAGKWVVKAPLAGVPVLNLVLPVGCFSIDDRDFSIDPLSSARVTFEADLVVTDRDMKVDTYDGRRRARIGESHNVDCKTGADLQAPRSAPDSDVSISDVKSSQRGLMQVFNVRASTPNPYYDWVKDYIPSVPVVGTRVTGAPRIDFEVAFAFNVVAQKILISGSTGDFPSFEAYYSIDNGPVVKVLNRSQSAVGPIALADFGTGINTQNFKAEISLPAP
ncbi:hypothetical protein ACVIIW_006216 [Bradyrhizobium sp. USDA 4449]